MKDCIESILVSEEEIDSITSSLAEKITEDYKNSEKPLVLLCLLKGSIMFTTELMKKISIPTQFEAMKASSYGSSSVSSGKVNIQLDINRDDISEISILIIEDIIDSGYTLSRVCQHLRDKGATDIKICTLLDKPGRRKIDIKADYFGKIIPDEFVVGFGLDYDEKFRNLPYVGILKPSVYSK